MGSSEHHGLSADGNSTAEKKKSRRSLNLEEPIVNLGGTEEEY